MTAFTRWCKFNLVGVMGAGLQLAALSLLNRCPGCNYLFATAVAIELTLLHNFVWHWHYTWRDRRAESALLARLAKFHLSNGLVSLLGNLLLMRFFVQAMRMPVLPANCVAILLCSIINFWVGNDWAFALKPPPESY